MPTPAPPPAPPAPDPNAPPVPTAVSDGMTEISLTQGCEIFFAETGAAVYEIRCRCGDTPEVYLEDDMTLQELITALGLHARGIQVPAPE